jgi:hypothetical protein
VLVKYPRYWRWVTDQTKLEPSLPKYLEIHGAEQEPKLGSWEDSQNQNDWRIWGIKTPDGENSLPGISTRTGRVFPDCDSAYPGILCPVGRGPRDRLGRNRVCSTVDVIRCI